MGYEREYRSIEEDDDRDNDQDDDQDDDRLPRQR